MVSQVIPNDDFEEYAKTVKKPFVPLEKRRRDASTSVRRFHELTPDERFTSKGSKNPFVHPAELDVQKGNILIGTDSMGHETIYLVHYADYKNGTIIIRPRAGRDRWSEYKDNARRDKKWRVAPGAHLALPAPRILNNFAVEVPVVKLLEADRELSTRETAMLLIAEAGKGWWNFQLQARFKVEIEELRRRKYIETRVGRIALTEKGQATIDALNDETEGPAWMLIAREHRSKRNGKR